MKNPLEVMAVLSGPSWQCSVIEEANITYILVRNIYSLFEIIHVYHLCFYKFAINLHHYLLCKATNVSMAQWA